MTNPVVLEATISEIHTGTIAALSATAFSRFSLQATGQSFSIDVGTLEEDGWVSSVKAGDKHRVSVRLIGWLKVKGCFASEPVGPNNSYGPRFYPFMASNIVSAVYLRDGNIGAMRISIPIRYRAAWHDCYFYGNQKISPELSASFSKDTRDYLLRWESGVPISSVSVDMPIRMGGPLLLRYAQYPFFHVVMSFVALALAAQTSEANRAIAVYGTLLAAYGFLLKHWGDSEVPQADVLLTLVYIFMTVLLLFSAIALHQLGHVGLLMAVPVFVFAWLGWFSVNRFRHQGILPEWVLRFWCRRIARTRSSQMSLARSSERHGADE